MESTQNFYLKKNPVFHHPLKPNEILVSRKKHFSVYMKRIHTLLFNVDKKDKTLVTTFDEVYLQGMGACVQKTVDLALQF